MPAGYSKTPLLKKLGIKPGHQIILHEPIPEYLSLIGELPEEAIILPSDAETADFIHLFFDKKSELKKWLPAYKKKLKKDGLLWISWPKKASKLPTDLSGNLVREIGLASGLVDVKVCAVDENWSGHKFVFRLKDR